MGVREIATFLVISRQRADQLSREKGFPEPYDTLGRQRIWRTEDIEAWAATRRPEPPPS